MTATRIEASRGGVRATKAFVGAFEIQRLRFPPRHAIDWFEPVSGYVAVPIRGGVYKTFRTSALSLEPDAFATVPAGASHLSDFARQPTEIVTLHMRAGAEDVGLVPLVRRRSHVRAAAARAICARLAVELHAADDSWALAAEGLVLQFLAAANRGADARDARGPRWVAAARELLHERSPDALTLTDLAHTLGVHPTHLARTFKATYGVTVGEYARNLRLEWAAAALAGTDMPLAQVAAEAGFADQSHFTRAFRRHAGATPGRYRELVQR